MLPIPETPDTSQYLRINELKNYVYCPRISYYALVLRLDRTTGLAEAGIEAERETRGRMGRRRQALHEVVSGERHFDVPLVSHRYGLVGRLDELVQVQEGVYLVDYKDTDRDYGYWRIQMAAYALCAGEILGQRVLDCYVYAIPTRQYHAVKWDARHLRTLENALAALRGLIQDEICPPPTPQTGKCRTCQYQRFCNDVT